MKFKTQVQLQNEVRQKEANADFVYVHHRLGLRGCAFQVIDMFINTVTDYIDTTSLKADASFDVMYSTYADGQQAFFKINGEEMEGEDEFVGDFFDTLPEVIFIIHGSNQPLRNLQFGQSDAIYTHDFRDMDEAGEIDVTIRFPENSEDISSFLKENRKELIGLLAHEMQHAVQKLVYGVRLSEHTVQDLESHINDIYEIDSRVEEAIARLPEHISEDNEADFLVELTELIQQYLTRNATDVENIEDIKVQMLEVHLEHYHRKLGKNNVM